MGIYIDKVNSFNPRAFYWFTDTAQVEMEDISGNDKHGEHFEDAVFGMASPIETEATSFAVSGRVGFIPVSVLGELAETYTLIGWAFNDGSGALTTIARNNQMATSAANLMGFTGANQAGAQLHNFTEDYSRALSFPDLPEGWYFLAVRRQANVAHFLVQAVLRDFAENVPPGSFSPYNPDAELWTIGIGSGAAALAFASAGVAAPAFFDTWLSDAALLEIFESAFLNPPLTLRADLHFNCTLEIDDEPTPVLFPFRPDWTAPISETLAWLTDVRPADQDYEQRAALRQRVRRQLEFQALVLDPAERRRFRAFLRKHQKDKLYLAIDTDAVPLTANAAAGATELDFNAEFRDFNDGAKLALYDDFKNFEVVTIDTVGDESTTLAGETTLDHTKQTLAIPVVRALLQTNIEIVRETDVIEEAPLSFRVLAEDVPLAPHRLGTFTPTYTYEGDVEVFDPFALGPSNWDEDGRGRIVIRAADPESRVGIFSRDARDTASREITSYTFYLDGREEIATFLAWWYSMKGRLKPIWVPTLQEDFEPISATFGEVTVEGNEYFNFYRDQPNRRDVVFVYDDETMIFRRITGVTAGSGQETLEFEGSDPNTLANLRCLSFLKYSRLNEDAIELTWSEDDHVDVTLNFIDLLTTP